MPEGGFLMFFLFPHPPERPSVAVPDSWVALWSTIAIWFAPVDAKPYFAAAALLFFVSALYHCAPTTDQSSYRYRFDRAMIHVMILATPLPELPEIIITGYYLVYVAACVWVAVWASGKIMFGWVMYKGRWPTAVYFVTYLLGIVSLWGVQSVMPVGWLVLKWTGVIGYFISAIIYNSTWRDHEWRCLWQHRTLYVAFGTHAVAAFLYA